MAELCELPYTVLRRVSGVLKFERRDFRMNLPNWDEGRALR
jgi:hypothetical protein